MATSTSRVLGARSSLLNHDFPKFYACYLLKSIQPPLSSSATYIGSTPSPPRRLRQHNGEIPAGGRRTASRRPWVMQMIVHGFPSKLAALQFEWAWQHPHKSRHFREDEGRIFGNRGTKRIDKLIQIVRTMITRHPFNTWPLHVKLFTQEAVKFWEAASASEHAPAMPPGFTCSIELEGMDGKSGHTGSGRKGPIEVDDAEFTNAHLAKHTSLLATGRRLECNICHKPMHSYGTEPLKTSLCPSLPCNAVSHLSCLSQHFLTSEGANKQNQNKSMLIPRGGHCKTCDNYILWGDVIRGSYRRFRAMQKTQDGADNMVVEDDLFVSDEDEMSEVVEDGIDESPIKLKKKSAKRQATDGPISSRSARRKCVDKKTTKGVTSMDRDKTKSSSGESFNFDDISSSSESGTATVRRRGRPPKTIQVSSPVMSPGSRAHLTKASVRRAPGRPRKELSTTAGSHSKPENALESPNSDSKAEVGPRRKTGSKDSPKSRLRLPAVSPASLLRKGKGKTETSETLFSMDEIRAALTIVEHSRKNIVPLSSTFTRPNGVDKRQRSRPRKSSTLLSHVSNSAEESSISSDPPRPDIVKRGRPRDDASLPSPSETRKPGRPKKTDGSPSSGGELIITSGAGPEKRKPGRPRKLSIMSIDGLIPSPSATAFSPKKGIHTQSSSSGESFDFAGLSDSEASEDNFDVFLAKRKLKTRSVSPPSELSRKSPGKPRNGGAPIVPKGLGKN